MKIVALRSLGWAILLSTGIFSVAWLWSWQVAGVLALGVAVILVTWHTWHLQVLLRAMQGKQHIFSMPNMPNTFGIWGEAFYWLHRLVKSHHLELAALQAQQDRLVQALQASPNAFVLLDSAGRVAWLNAAAQGLLGLEAERDTGQNLTFLLRTPAVAALLDSTQTQLPIMVETQGRVIKVQSLPFGDKQTLLLGQDFTELARTEQVRRDFVANVSHELRTPLTVLTGYTELLHDYAAYLPAALQEAVVHMVHHTQRMNSLTQDLLQLAVLDASKTADAVLNHESVNVMQWLTQVQASTTALANTAQGKIILEFVPCDSQLTVVGNAQELHSALSNLVGNALRYTAAGGRVSVVAQVQNDGLYIAVTDTGCGIEAVHLPRITERFYRASACRSREVGAGNDDASTGTGLGLAIVKHIMLRHGGELRITSTVGQGSCFTLVLPVMG